MAVDGISGPLENARLIGGDVVINLRCPPAFIKLLKGTLSGWKILSGAPGDRCEIAVRRLGARYEIDSLTIDKPGIAFDLVDALNFVFLAIAYWVKAKSGAVVLLHGAAYRDDQKTLVIFGSKGSGKSSLVFSQALNRRQVMADDLLLWDLKQNHFVALGLPLRMRRPIPESLRVADLSEKLIVGQRIAYSRGEAFDVAAVGYRFFPDAIQEMGSHRKLSTVPLFRVLGRIKKYSISSRFTEERDKSIGHANDDVL